MVSVQPFIDIVYSGIGYARLVVKQQVFHLYVMNILKYVVIDNLLYFHLSKTNPGDFVTSVS